MVFVFFSISLEFDSKHFIHLREWVCSSCDVCRCERECSMFHRALLLLLCDGHRVIPFQRKNDLYFKLDHLVSEWECYTIGKSGLEQQERQNSQSWADKLHWCGTIWSFACGVSAPFSPFCTPLLPLGLNWTPNILYIPKDNLSYYIFILSSFCWCLLCAVCTYLVFLGFTLCVSSLCSLTVFWTQSCLACRLEGEWLLTSWSDQFTSKYTPVALLFRTPHSELYTADIAHSMALSPT